MPLSRLDLPRLVEAIRILHRTIETPPSDGWHAPAWLVERHKCEDALLAGLKKEPQLHRWLFQEARDELLGLLSPHRELDCPEITDSKFDQTHKLTLLELREKLLYDRRFDSVIENGAARLQSLAFLESVSQTLDNAESPAANVEERWAGILHEILWKNTAERSLTSGFKGKGHDDLLGLLQGKVDKDLEGKPNSILLQSLQDAGCDLLIDWGSGQKYGIQLKSHFDIGEKDFQKNTLAQIQRSKEHGLKRLYVLLAGDMTERSQEQKVRGFEANISKQNDEYVVTISPERLWTLLFG